MNVYLMNEDNDHCCIRAKTMAEAIMICEKSYLDDRKEEEPECNIDQEREYYYKDILQSCSLIGELKN